PWPWDPQTPSQLSQFPLSLIPEPPKSLCPPMTEPSPGVPQFMAIGFVDGIPFVRYNSERGQMEPLTQWMKDGAEPEYWDGQTQRVVRKQHVHARNLKTVQERYNQSRRELWSSIGCSGVVLVLSVLCMYLFLVLSSYL
uniref:MHC class I-like antigen recognition-like domain-containing protein n=1 Tax=Zosterops lateralis melanops TaxID=1220523 RepID=A0A8D2P3H4_ZOSLA